MRLITDSDGLPCGRAALAFEAMETGIHSIGGFVSGAQSQNAQQFSKSYIGAMSFEPEGPQRFWGKRQLLGNITEWANTQASLLAGMDIGDVSKYIASVNIAYYQGDPSPVAMILINREVKNLEYVYQKLIDQEKIYAPIEWNGDNNESLRIKDISFQTPGISRGFGPGELQFLVLVMEPSYEAGFSMNSAYHAVPTEKNPAPSSFLSCLERHAKSNGQELQMEIVNEMPIATYIGKDSPREGLVHGHEFKMPTLKITLHDGSLDTPTP